MNNIELVKWNIKNGLDGIKPATKAEFQVLGILGDDISYGVQSFSFPGRAELSPSRITYDTDGAQWRQVRTRYINDQVKDAAWYFGMANAKNKIPLLEHVERMDSASICGRDRLNKHEIQRVACYLDRENGFFQWYYNFDPVRNGPALQQFLRMRDAYLDLGTHGVAILPYGEFRKCITDILAFAYDQRRRWFRDALHENVIARFNKAEFTK